MQKGQVCHTGSVAMVTTAWFVRCCRVRQLRNVSTRRTAAEWCGVDVWNAVERLGQVGV